MDPSLEAMLAEYGVLRAEISRRVGYQLVILGVNVALVAAVISASDRLGAVRGSLFLLIAPLLLCVVGVFYFDQDLLITDVASYLERDLRLRVRRHIAELSQGSETPDLWRWEVYRKSLLSRSWQRSPEVWLTGAFRVIAGCGPTLGSIIGAGLSYSWSSQSPALIGVAAGVVLIDVGALAALCVLAARVPRMYLRISGDASLAAGAASH